MILGGVKVTKVNKSFYRVEMVARKTRRRKIHSKRKTSRRIHRHRTVRRKKGGRLNQQNNQRINNNGDFDDRRGDLINTLQDIMDRAEQGREQPNVNEMTFVDEIRTYEAEADAIDAHFSNHDMEDMLNQRIEDIMHIFGLVNNHNNNETITLPNHNRNRNNNNLN
jgi:hypothetical protein